MVSRRETGAAKEAAIKEVTEQSANSASCGNCLSSLLCAARLHASHHDGRMPSNMGYLREEDLGCPFILVCPGNRLQEQCVDMDGDAFDLEMSNYQIVNPGVRDTAANLEFLRCRIHGNAVFVDGTVIDGADGRRKHPKTFDLGLSLTPRPLVGISAILVTATIALVCALVLGIRKCKEHQPGR